jgi:hypothetical protein
MKITLTESEFVSRFRAIRPEQFSIEALRALFDFLDEQERDLGEEQELDVIAICCDWTEYPSALEAAEAYGFKAKDSEDEKADKAEEDAFWFLRDETTVIELESGAVVVLNY